MASDVVERESFADLLNETLGSRDRLEGSVVKGHIIAIENDFASQLTSLYRTTEDETPTGQSIQSWIASSVPLDDSVREIAEIVVRVRRAPKGNEGAIVKLDKINKNEPRVQKSN